ncbi:MAG: ABC transporter permease [Planctomycetota bacterium]|nr:ABC transporter permease [Planctomycetota bacterium]
MTQTIALIVDAYRELNAKKLFWITMLLSGLVVLIYAAIGINENGVTFLWFGLDFLPMTSEQVPPAMLYKMIFINLGIGIWLTWIAAVLALISTAGIIPEMISGGSIEMLLSKPISRTRLFVTKYITGLLFAALQVLVFTTACFLVIGIRGGSWEPSLFLAVPLVVCFFSYLFAFCALIGVLTRSTIAALLLTLLFWFGLFVINTGDNVLMAFKTQFETQRDGYQASLDSSREAASKILTSRRADSDDPLPADYVATDEDMRSVSPWIAKAFDNRDEAAENIRKIEPWTKGVYLAKTALPKTQETVALLERWTISKADLQELSEKFKDEDEEPGPTLEETGGNIDIDQDEVSRRMQEKIRERPAWWVIGTSLLYELFIVGIAAFIFKRRDH